MQWISSPKFSYDPHVSLPLVTFGPNSNYRDLMIDALRTAGIDHYVAFESESSAGVRSAVAAGFGIALINERGVTAECQRWEPPGEIIAMPTASFVVRVNSRSRTAAVRTLIDEICATLV